VTDGPVLAVFAHPDDAEISAGGSLAKWAAAGREVHLLILTNGDRGSGDAERNRQERSRARHPDGGQQAPRAGRDLGRFCAGSERISTLSRVHRCLITLAGEPATTV